jgi:hypothetical protein
VHLLQQACWASVAALPLRTATKSGPESRREHASRSAGRFQRRDRLRAGKTNKRPFIQKIGRLGNFCQLGRGFSAERDFLSRAKHLWVRNFTSLCPALMQMGTQDKGSALENPK